MYPDFSPSPLGSGPSGEPEPFGKRFRRLLVGAPRSLGDRSLYHRLSLIAVLAWVGLGADGLSSSAYGPEEAFRQLGEHTYLALGLALVMATTVIVIAYAYSRVIEHFPHGGGGYVVATSLLGPRAGVVSGGALLVDYVLTITMSLAAAGNALFSLLPMEWHAGKLPVAVFLTVFMIVLNLRGVRESVLILAPIFLLFAATHTILIAVGLAVKAPGLPATLHTAGEGFSAGLAGLGIGGMLALFLRAYALGGGTYTGIEAVSNGLAIMREPHVQTGKRTMLYMATSLAFTASGLLLCYLLWQVSAVEGKTMNAVLTERFVQVVPLGQLFVILTLVSEGALLVVAAQAGFVDGPRILANMAVDSWMPRRFASLSDRLTTQNGILLMGVAALGALLYTGGDVRSIVVLYSINVFLTFSMTEISMCRYWITERRRQPDWWRKIAIHAIGMTMCLTILAIIVYEKFGQGGWLTLVVTSVVVGLCFLVKGHYRLVGVKLFRLEQEMAPALAALPPASGVTPACVDPSQPAAVVLVASYGGLGIHTVLNVFRIFPGHFKNLVFLSVGVLGSGEFKGGNAVEDLRLKTSAELTKYAALAARLGVPAATRLGIGTDAVDEAEKLCLAIADEFPKATFFAGKILFQRERWYQRLLHNETAFSLQKRLQWVGKAMIIIPARVR